jgi:hypothetical protein
VPGAVGTNPYDLNDRGQLVGIYSTTNPNPAGADDTRGLLLRDGAGGPFTAIDVPGAPTTSATGINDAGVIVGPYENSNAAPGPQPAGRQPLQTMPRALATR